jgi:hypothetical protein
MLLMLIGAVYLMYGWSLHKGLVTLNAAAVGGFAGAWIGDKAGYPLARNDHRRAGHGVDHLPTSQMGDCHHGRTLWHRGGNGNVAKRRTGS